jgi:hypothetical protein
MKKKTPRKKPWRTGFWDENDEIRPVFTYGKLQKQEILNVLPDGVEPGEALEKFEEYARALQRQAEHELEKPLPRTIREQLTKLERHTRTLLDTLNELHSPTRQVLNGKPPVLPLRTLIGQLQTLHTRAGWLCAARKQPGVGRPKKTTTRPKNMRMRWFVERLITWWTTYLPDSPLVSYHNDVTDNYDGDFHALAVATIIPVFGRRGLDAIIERMVHAWNHAAKNS